MSETQKPNPNDNAAALALAQQQGLAPVDNVFDIPVSKIVFKEEDRVRPVDKDSDHYKQLMETMDRYGLFQPITVRPSPNPAEAAQGIWEVWNGFHRTNVAKDLGWRTIRASVQDVSQDEMPIKQLIANYQKPMSPVQKAKVLKKVLARPENIGKTYTDLLTDLGLVSTKSDAQWVLQQLRLADLIKPAQDMIEQQGTDRGTGFPLSYAITLSKFPVLGPEFKKEDGKFVTDDKGKLIATGEDIPYQQTWFDKFKSYNDSAQWQREANIELDAIKSFLKGKKHEKDQFTGSHARKPSEIKSRILSLQKQGAGDVDAAQSIISGLDEQDHAVLESHFRLQEALWMLHMDPDSVAERDRLAAMKTEQREALSEKQKEVANMLKKINDPEALQRIAEAAAAAGVTGV